MFKYISRSPKPCVGGYTVKRPRFDPVDVQAESNPGRGSTYFPVGEERRPVQDEDRTTTTIRWGLRLA